MPPTSGGLRPVLGSFLDTEGTGDSVLDNREVLQYSEIPSGLSNQQIYILRCVSLSLSLFTLSLIVLVTYWFFRMRRSFRHDLIMLLIVSDGLEALFFMIFPIVDFAMGPIQSESVFCQMSGFFLAVGIEASDIAVALIAIHTALYIFKPRQLNGQSGLYPYRRTAYAVLFILPVVLASLAFINTPAYVNNGQYCYLPIRPLWARLALSWIPRYIILLIIFVSYLCTYIYVSVLMHRFGEESKMRRHSNAPPPPPVSSDQTTSSPSNVSNNQADTRNGSVPPTPPIAYHGLIPSTSDSHHSCSEEERQRHGSVSSEGSCGEPLRRPLAGRLRVDSHHTAHGIRWKWPLFGGEAVASMDTEQQQQRQQQEQHTTQHDAHVEAAIASPPPARTSDPSTARHSLPPSLGKTTVSSTPSPSPFLFAVAASAAPLRRTGGPGTGTGIGATATDPSGSMARARLKIRRQLRLLFHVLRWNEPLRAGPFGLVLASLVSLCMQGAADAGAARAQAVAVAAAVTRGEGRGECEGEEGYRGFGEEDEAKVAEDEAAAAEDGDGVVGVAGSRGSGGGGS
ncbi:G protein-coupled receptor GPR1 like [Verticillium longisporum]|uniref:G protein-coupled receptor GPR1 like n=1 Tax=Verticillium longisporum TaxID=100787 RepID=A0A8I3ANM8_VERLO|nr:G protein-coupled receptor GPR1 like [Verticillium longisporum]